MQLLLDTIGQILTGNLTWLSQVINFTLDQPILLFAALITIVYGIIKFTISKIILHKKLAQAHRNFRAQFVKVSGGYKLK